MPIALLEQSERVDKTRVHQVLEPPALLVGEALLTPIRLGVRKIQLRMGNVEVPTKHDRLALLELLHIREKCRVPVPMAQSQAAQVVLGVRRVYRDHVEVLELGSKHAAF